MVTRSTRLTGCPRPERRRPRRAGRPMSTDAVAALFVSRETPIREVIEVIDRSGKLSVALLVDDLNRLVATITDGDVRRAILSGLKIDAAVETILPLKATLPNPEPVTAPAGIDLASALGLMQTRRVRQLPIVDAESHVVDVMLLSDLLPQPPDAMRAVIMAGGFGTRLRPLTENVPKPMLPVGGRPLIERIVGQLKESGVDQIVVTTHYKPESIVDHFGDGANFGVTMTYVHEDEPLGTGGALGLIPTADEPLLVINGDILTQVDFRALLEFHREYGADLTVGVRAYTLKVPYGVVEHNGARVMRIDEKPEIALFVNAGIYVVEPAVRKHLDGVTSLGMTDLIQAAIQAGQVVVSFPVLEYWMDVGQTNDYQQAQADGENGMWR
jgi:dTDP-glucose pyrophosphorylase/CBS domain-containing protein